MQANKRQLLFLILTMMFWTACGNDFSERRTSKKSSDVVSRELDPLNLKPVQDVSIVQDDDSYSKLSSIHSSQFLLVYFYNKEETKALRDSLEFHSRSNTLCKAIVLGERTRLRDYMGTDFPVPMYSINMNALAFTRRFIAKAKEEPHFFALDRSGNVMFFDQKKYPSRTLPFCLDSKPK